jgi:hypothetical protein
MSVDEYIKLGIPDPGKTWNIDDYHMAYSILGKLKWEKPFQLPMKGSEKSGALFERMVSFESFAFAQDSAISLSEKAARISEFLKVYAYWIDVYTHPGFKKPYYHREIVDIKIFNLRVAELTMNLAHQIYVSDDPANAGLKYAYGSIKRDYLTSLLDDLKTQSNTAQFVKEDLDRMADSIFVSVMRNKELIDSSAVSNLKQSLHVVLDSTRSDYVRKKYTSLEKSI